MKSFKTTFALIFTTLLFCQSAFAQNLLQERIRRIPSRKRSIYLDTGIFHNGAPKKGSQLKAVRHNFSKRNGYERVVMDFETKELPRVYGYISREENKLYLDLFETGIPKSLSSFGDSKYVKELLFFPIQKDTLSVEVIFKTDVTLDVFYLTNPGRLVIDIKK